MKLFYQIAIAGIDFELWCIRGQIYHGKQNRAQAQSLQARILILRERKTIYQTALHSIGA
jgi:hypothetical protein